MKKLFQDCMKLKHDYEKVVIKSNKLKKIIKKEIVISWNENAHNRN